MTEYLYKIHNNLTDEVYIGCSKDPYQRFKKHQSSLRGNRHTSERFQELYNSNPNDLTLRLEIIEKVDDDRLAREKEKDLLSKTDNRLNTRVHGTGGDKISMHPKNSEFREKQKKNAKSNTKFINSNRHLAGVQNPNYRHGKTVRNRTCPECGGHMGNFSEVCIHCVDKTGSKNPFYGRTHTAETRAKLSAAFKGVPNISSSKKISVDGVIYDSCTEAASQLNIKSSTLSWRARNGKNKNVFYINEDENEMPND